MPINMVETIPLRKDDRVIESTKRHVYVHKENHHTWDIQRTRSGLGCASSESHP